MYGRLSIVRTRDAGNISDQSDSNYINHSSYGEQPKIATLRMMSFSWLLAAVANAHEARKK